MNINDILNQVKESSHQRVMVAIADVDGILRGKYMHTDKFLASAEKGFGFCNVVFGWDAADICYDNTSYTGWHSGYPDANARIDLSTFRRLPWNDNMPFFLAEFTDSDNNPLGVCPRQTLRRVIAKAESMGFTPKSGVEFEWFNFRETPESLQQKNFLSPQPITPGMFGYSLIRAGQNQEFFNDLMDELSAFGVPIEGLHTETGPGVYEAAILFSDVLEAADRAILFKLGAKKIGHKHGIMPTFMAKWNKALPGSSGHLHESLADKNGKNIFHDGKNQYGMSETFQHFLAGQLQLLPEILVMLAPTVNSYKRLVEGMWAPTRQCWGIDNRTAALRVIQGGEKATRVEVRSSGADINPYLALAASFAAGLYGIENKLPLKTAPVQGSAYLAKKAARLPQNLYEATEKFFRSRVTRELFGNQFVEHFAASRYWEWEQFQAAVTNWESERYFEII